MTIIRRNLTKKGSNYAKGKHAVAICQRSGFKYPYSEMVFEPGTNLFVHKSETDGSKNIVTDPLNYVSDKMKQPETIALKNPSPEEEIPIVLVSNVTAGTVVSADNLALSAIIPDTNFYQFYPGTSTTTD